MIEDWMDEAEIRHLSGKVRPSAQRRALAKMRVRFTMRPDGSPAVLREHVTGAVIDRKKKAEPEWQAAR